MTFNLVDNSALVLNALQSQVEAALEAVGQQAETHAKQNLTASGKRDSGNLVNSIAHEVRPSEDAVYVGSNVEYAKYVEYGTGIYGENGGTGSGWWVYVTGGTGLKYKIKGAVRRVFGIRGKRYTRERAAQIVAILRSKGLDAHMTQGQRPTHFLRDAIQKNIGQYKQIVETYLKR